MAGGYDGTIKIDTSIDGRNFNKGISGMMGSLKGLAAAVGLAVGVGALVAFGKASVDAASNVQEMSNKFAVVFKSMAGSVEQQLTTFASATNRSKYDLMGFAAMIQDTFVPLGFARQTAADMSVQVVKLATDLGSFNNIPTAQVVADIQSALVGQIETVRKYGVVLSQARLEQEAQTMGLWNGAGAMSAQARAAATLALIMSMNADAQGDAIRTSGSYANQMRGLAASFMDLKIAIGNSIIPIIAQVLPYIAAAIRALTAFFQQLAQIVNLLFGTNITTAGAAAADTMNTTADSTDNAAKSQGNLAKNTKAAGQAAKGALAAFDQLNVLQQTDPNASAAGGGSGGGGAVALPAFDTTPLGQAADDANKAFDALARNVEIFKIKFLEFIQPVVLAFGRLQIALAPLGATIWSGLKWAWDNILVPLGKWVITDLLPNFLDLLSAGAGTLNDVLIALKPLGQWLWDKFLKPLADWTGGVIIDILKGLTDKLKDLGDWINNNQDAFQLFVVIIASIGPAFWAAQLAIAAYNIVANIGAVASFLFAAALTAIDWPLLLVTLAIIALIAVIYLLIRYWPEITKAAADVWVTIQQLWALAGWWFSANVVDPIKKHFADMWETLKQWAYIAWNFLPFIWLIASEWFRVNVTEPIGRNFNAIWESIKLWSFNAWEYIKNAWKNGNAWFQTNVILPLQGAFMKLWESIKTYASNAWQYIIDKFKSLSAWAQTNIVDPIKNAFDSALKSIDGQWRSVFNGILGFTKWIINGIIGNLNGMINGLNSVINLANNSGSILPGWVNIPAFPTIPYLAKGAVIPPNAQFAAILGDQKSGRNIETPEALMRQIFREEAGGKGGGEIVIRFEGNMSELVRVLKPYIDKENGRIGGSLIASGTTL